MSRAAIVAYLTSAYLAVLGVALVVVPNLLLPLFGFSPTGEVWIRVVGALTASFAWYGFVAARSEDISYFRASVVQQPALCLVFVGLVVAGLAAPMLIGFGVTQLLFGLAMWWALRSRLVSA